LSASTAKQVNNLAMMLVEVEIPTASTSIQKQSPAGASR
jgi:hypothetical protein